MMVEPAYTPAQVERILKNYLTIRSMLDGSSRPPMVVLPADPKPADEPLLDRGPFSIPKHARVHIDGKARARATEELLVCTLDLEDGIKRMPKREAVVLAQYFIYESHTLEELCADWNVNSRASMHKIIKRLVRRLTEVMNYGEYAR